MIATKTGTDAGQAHYETRDLHEGGTFSVGESFCTVMKVTLDYGQTGLLVDLPDENVVAVLKQLPAVPIQEPAQNTVDALRHPIGTRPLSEIARTRPNGTACIVVCDLTRPVPNAVLLPPIISELKAGGIAQENITILIATGTHRPNVGEELIQILGEELARMINIVNHVCTDAEAMRDFGTTLNGVPVKLNRIYVDADIKVTVGLIEPHFMAGYSGGRKMIMPGIAALETIQAWHSPRFLEHPNATAGITSENPVHEENTRIAKLCPPDMMVDVTLDNDRQITGIFAGDLVEAWQTGVAFAAEHVKASVDAAVDIAVTTCAGFPLDATFYQAVKGMVGALPIVKPGGTIIIAAACSEGVGSTHFLQTLLAYRHLNALVEAMSRPDWQPIPDQWEVEELARATRHHEIIMVCEGISHDLLAQLHVHPAISVEVAVATALEKHGSDARIAVIPKGPYVIPFIA